jgi:hypothetical protein
MIITPSENPGSHERHLLRRVNNPLFGHHQPVADNDAMMDAQQKDHDILLAFHKEFQQVLQDTVNLKPNVESDVVLTLKDQLDKLYEQASRIADDQTETREAIKKLLTIIMATIRNGAANDPQAQQELDQEETARQTHFALLQSKLVADLLDPDSVIQEQHLVPTLLSTDKDELASTLQIFDASQLELITQQGNQLLTEMAAKKIDASKAAENLVFIEGYIEFLNTQKKSQEAVR